MEKVKDFRKIKLYLENHLVFVKVVINHELVFMLVANVFEIKVKIVLNLSKIVNCKLIVNQVNLIY